MKFNTWIRRDAEGKIAGVYIVEQPDAKEMLDEKNPNAVAEVDAFRARVQAQSMPDTGKVKTKDEAIDQLFAREGVTKADVKVWLK